MAATATPTAPASPIDVKSRAGEEREFLTLRGWRDNMNGTWSDMSPPPDKEVEVQRITQQDGSVKIIKQVLAGPPVSWAYPMGEALAMEKGRKREPLPMYHTFLSRLNNAGVEGSIKAEKWFIRDRWKTINTEVGPFDNRPEADAWLAANNK